MRRRPFSTCAPFVPAVADEGRPGMSRCCWRCGCCSGFCQFHPVSSSPPSPLTDRAHHGAHKNVHRSREGKEEIFCSCQEMRNFTVTAAVRHRPAAMTPSLTMTPHRQAIYSRQIYDRRIYRRPLPHPPMPSISPFTPLSVPPTALPSALPSASPPAAPPSPPTPASSALSAVPLVCKG